MSPAYRKDFTSEEETPTQFSYKERLQEERLQAATRNSNPYAIFVW